MCSADSDSTVRKPTVFDLTDPAERFIVERIQFFFSEKPTVYRVLAMRRVEGSGSGPRQRRVLQAVRHKQQRRTARPEWLVMVWDIDAPGVTFLKLASRATMLDLYRSFTAADVATRSPADRDTSKRG